MLDVVCVGILVADVVVQNIENLPETGMLQPVDRIELFSGGCASNAAIGMARLGLNVAVAGKIGDDGFGCFLKKTLTDEKVNIDSLCVDKNVNTSGSIVIIDKSGERSFLHYKGANAAFSVKDISHSIIEQAEIVFVAGTFLMPEFDGEQCASLLKKAKSMGKITALDTAWDASGKWMNVLRPCMEHIDLFMPSYDEAVCLSGKKEPEEIADVFLDMGVKTAVIKLGHKGCLIKDSSGEKHYIPAFEGIRAVDTTGAGDSFCAGFLTGIRKGWSLDKCGILANATGAHCVMATGSVTGIKSFEETMNFIKERSVFA